jgi:putative ABC transport system ATP-binding protein
MITIQQLKFQYPRSDFQLAIEQLEISAGEKLAIIGPSGSGKTTLLNLISGIELPERGKVKIGEVELTQLSDAKRRSFRIKTFGQVFQQFELIEYLSVLDNILLPFAINSSLTLTPAIRSQAILQAESFGLGDKLKRKPGKLSQGEQQRVAVCRALINRPPILLADEPTGNLDPANKHRILEILFQQATQQNQTLIMVTHDLNIVEGFDRTIDFATFFAPETPAGEVLAK